MKGNCINHHRSMPRSEAPGWQDCRHSRDEPPWSLYRCRRRCARVSRILLIKSWLVLLVVHFFWVDKQGPTRTNQDKPTGKEFSEFFNLLQWQSLQPGKTEWFRSERLRFNILPCPSNRWFLHLKVHLCQKVWAYLIWWPPQPPDWIGECVQHSNNCGFIFFGVLKSSSVCF